MNIILDFHQINFKEVIEETLTHRVPVKHFLLRFRDDRRNILLYMKKNMTIGIFFRVEKI